MIKIAPSIIAADQLNLQNAIIELNNSNADYVHIDIMDGYFVKNITIGIDITKSIQAISDIPLDVHLMVENPEIFIPMFLDCKPNRISIHWEVVENNFSYYMNFMKNAGIKIGIAVNLETDISCIENVLWCIDTILVMSVNPGKCGQSFESYALDKVRHLSQLRLSKALNFEIEVDGGINVTNSYNVINVGADILVSGSGVFNSNISVQDAILHLKSFS